jgi:hypothetical protein
MMSAELMGLPKAILRKSAIAQFAKNTSWDISTSRFQEFMNIQIVECMKQGGMHHALGGAFLLSAVHSVTLHAPYNLQSRQLALA